MRTLRRSLARLLNFTVNRRGDERLREEIESHIAAQTDENIRAGMAHHEARRQACLKFGAVAALTHDYNAEKGLPFVDNLLLDIRYSLRVLRKSPAFTVVALITLMLGIGANVVVFGVVNAVLLQPLPVKDPQSLYQLRHKRWMSGRLLTTSYPALEDFRQQNTTFSGLAGVYGYSNATLSWHNTALKVHGDEVTGNYFDLLGVYPRAGRLFRDGDENGPGSAPYVVLSDTLWRSVFQSDPGVVGATVDLNKHPFTVIGVAPPGFHGAERFVWPDYWIPMANQAQIDKSDYLHSRTAVTVTVLGRLKPGVTPQQATDNLNAISAGLAKIYPETDDGQPLRLIHPGLYGDNGDVIRGFLWSVTALALLVLTAACANLATLFAARAADRGRELALRVALGSSRLRLVRQLLTEAVIVSLMGGAAGVVGAQLLLRLLNRSQPFAGALTVNVDARVYLAGLIFTLASALLFGMAPVRQLGRGTPLRMMKNGPPGAPRLRHVAMRDLLLGAQIAICTLLITASLVAVRGMVRVLRAPLGFQPRGAMLVELGDIPADKKKPVIEAARAIPGVTSAGMVNRTPMTGGIHGIPIFRAGVNDFKLNNSALSSYVFQMSPGYLEAAGTRLLTGRDFSWHDTADSPRVGIVNQSFARRMWGEAPPIGKYFVVSGNLTEVVGVAETGKYHDMEESPQPAAYLPLSQSEQSEAAFVVRSQRPPGEMAAALQRTLSGIQPNTPVAVLSWPDALSDVLFPARAATVALGIMGLLAAMLAVTGIFGMANYSVSRRMKELGVRMALGARRRHVISAAVGRPMVLLGLGSLLGLLTGVLTSRLLQQIVYQANPGDPAIVGGAVLTMALLGAAASAIPALRALAVDPSELMRED
ncbi:MAG TPA: ABC transporter permease [Tepidisphaeraceae bacterium]|nr:ABC transporter permease [Tepidisphaeraceae bacterium]